MPLLNRWLWPDRTDTAPGTRGCSHSRLSLKRLTAIRNLNGWLSLLRFLAFYFKTAAGLSVLTGLEGLTGLTGLEGLSDFVDLGGLTGLGSSYS